MSVCICGASALEFMRSSGRLAPTFLEKRRVRKLDGCGAPSLLMMSEEFERLGVRTKPIDLLVASSPRDRKRDDIRYHRCAKQLPPRSLICVSDGVMVTSPSLTFLQLAALSRSGAEPMAIEDLAMIGFELCGTFVLDDSWDGLTNTEKPLTSVGKIANTLEFMKGVPGSTLAREALELVLDGSNSPMESVLCALFTWPRWLGGYALGPASLNHHVVTATGDRYVDLAFPEHKVGLEYKGREHHSVEQVGRDDRRQNKLVGSGWTILNVWYEDIVDAHLYGQLVDDVARAMGVRLRVRGEHFEARRELLRLKLVPAFRAYVNALAE